MPADTSSVLPLPGVENMAPRDRDRLSYELRQRGWGWWDIANHLAMGHESSARTAAGRHSRRLESGAPSFGYVPRGRRQVAEQVTWTPGSWTSASTPAPDSFTFGVEIECEGIGQPGAAAALATVLSYTPAIGGYHTNRSQGYQRWVIESDGSLSYGGAEVVSPILRGEAGIAEVVSVVDALRTAGATVSSRCGLHVHIHRGPLSDDQLSQVIDFYTLCQPAVSALLLRSRRGAYYARPVDGTIADQAKAFLRGARTHSPDRYLAFNMAHVHRVGTIEWRQHHGSLRSPEVSSWLRFLLGIYEGARLGAPLPTGPVSDVSEMVNLLPLRRVTANALIARPTRRRFA